MSFVVRFLLWGPGGPGGVSRAFELKDPGGVRRMVWVLTDERSEHLLIWYDVLRHVPPALCDHVTGEPRDQPNTLGTCPERTDVTNTVNICCPKVNIDDVAVILVNRITRRRFLKELTS